MVSSGFKTASGFLLFLACASTAGSCAQVAQDLSTATQSGFVRTADGVQIHYLEAGPRGKTNHKPAILFIPGWTMPAEIWEPQIKHFAKTYHVVAMDPRSQGKSTKTPDGNYPEAHARDIQAVVDQLKLAPAVLVGWSMGVDALMAYVDQFGCKDAAALVLVDGRPWSWDYLDEAAKKRFFAPLFKFQEDRQQAARNFVRGMYKHPQSPEYLERITQATLLTPTNTALALMVGVVAKDRRAALARIDKPTLIVVARRPDLKATEDMHSQIAGSRLEIMPGVGHALFADDPERFNTLLETFLNQLTKTKN